MTKSFPPNSTATHAPHFLFCHVSHIRDHWKFFTAHVSSRNCVLNYPRVPFLLSIKSSSFSCVLIFKPSWGNTFRKKKEEKKKGGKKSWPPICSYRRDLGFIQRTTSLWRIICVVNVRRSRFRCRLLLKSIFTNIIHGICLVRSYFNFIYFFTNMNGISISLV